MSLEVLEVYQKNEKNDVIFSYNTAHIQWYVHRYIEWNCIPQGSKAAINIHVPPAAIFL